MKRLCTYLLAVFAAGIMFAATANANAQVVTGAMRVQLPNGTVISVANTPQRPWYRDQRVAMYHRYVFDPVQHMYIIHDVSYQQPLHHVRHYKNNRPCTRGQAISGHCRW